MAVRRVDQPTSRPASRPVAAKPMLPPPRTGHSGKSTLTADAAERAAKARLTGQTSAPAKSPEVLKQELASLDSALAKKSLAPGLKAELRLERTEKLVEYRRTLQQRIANLEQVSKRAGPENSKVLAQLATYRADLEALNPTRAATTASTTSVPEAQKKVEEAFETGGAKAAMIELEKQSLAMSPADATKLIAATSPIIDQVAGDLMKGDNQDRAQALTSLSNATRHAGPAATEQVATQLADRVVQRDFDAHIGNLDNGFEAAIKAGAGPELAFAVQGQLVEQGKLFAAAKIAKATANAVEAPLKVYTEAQQQFVERETQLAQDLSELGPGMTPEQRQKYVDAFWADPKNKAVKDAYAVAEQNMATNFERNRPALEAAAARGDTKAAELLMKGVEALAQSPNFAARAIDFVDRLGRPENKALFDALNKDGKLEDTLAETILAPAIGNAQSKALTDGSFDDLVAQLKSIQKLGKNFKKLPGEIKSAIETVDKVKELLARGLEGPELMNELRLEGLTDGWDNKSKLGKAMAIFAVVGAIQRAGETTGGLEKLENSLAAVKGGLELTAGILGTLGRAQKLSGATQGARLIAKYLPAVGFAIDAAQLAQDIQKLRNGGNAGDAIATVGTVVNLIGDVAGVVPILGTAVDGILGTVGTILQGIGGLVSGFIEGDKERKERAADREKYLTAAGVSASDRAILTGGGLVDRSALGTMGLTREQFLAALEGMQNLPTNDDGKSAYAVQMAWNAAAAYGLTGNDALKFVEQMQKTVLDMSWEELGKLDDALSELARVPVAAELDGMSPAQRDEYLNEALEKLDFYMERNARGVFEQFDLDARDASDTNLEFFTSSDQR
ncbi:MAG: hypothetical protein Q8N26_05685 [Myxococcales bacterium]|nr:hypothetical protein [Myxococcales bacterium]